MQSENFDNKVREAANQHHPNYDEKAWSKMEKLLDQHLPQKDDRRRFILMLFFLLLLGGGAWLFISKPWDQTGRSAGVVNTPAKTATASPARASNEGSTGTTAEKNSVTNPTPGNDNKIVEPVTVVRNNDQSQDRKYNVTNSNAPAAAKQNKPARRSDRKKDDQLSIDQSNPSVTKQDTTPVKDDNNTVIVPAGGSKVMKNDDVAKNDVNKKADDQPQAGDVVAGDKTGAQPDDKTIDQPKKPEEKAVAKKSNGRKQNSFVFSFSMGPDISSVEMSNPGKVKLLGGAGVGYTFNRWTIRTGFYTTNKVYTASKYDYKPTPPVVNPNYLDEISADCKVYEIPLNLSYNFSRSNKHGLFATVGLSSLIMKKEEYKYLYTWPGNPPTSYTYTKTINNENKHYFSVLTLSGGYERRINKTLSISAEPYIKLPLTGIGFGNVKLNSAGVLFSVNLNPFH